MVYGVHLGPVGGSSEFLVWIAQSKNQTLTLKLHRMTMLAALMRGLGQHSSLADITLIRNFISIHHLLPLPPDAIVTPVRFVVKKRGKQALRGLLATLDAQEDGARTLSGEWVVNKSVWRRLRSEAREREMYSRRNKNADETLPSEAHARARASINKARDEKVIYFIHGGAYYVGGATTHRTITIALSKHCNCRVFAINYRLAPEVRFPEPLIDVVYGYLRLVEDLKIEPKNIVSFFSFMRHQCANADLAP